MRSVLIATADAALEAILSAEIGGEGFETLWAADGQDAIALVSAQSPSLVLLDASLPVFDGFEACAALRQDRHIPRELVIYLLTDEAFAPQRLEKAGFNGVFPKTHQFHEIRELLADIATRPDAYPAT